MYEKLSISSAGIICLTPENQHTPWIQFEAGALAKGLLENRVFILLIGIESNQIVGPLASFNHTPCTIEGFSKMVKNLNDLLGEKSLPQDILSRVFEKNISDLKTIWDSVIEMDVPNSTPPSRDSNEIQNEMLKILRGLSSRISNVEHSIIQNKGLIFTNRIPPAPKATIGKEIPDEVIKRILNTPGIWEKLKNAEVGEELTSSSKLGGGI